MFGLVLSSSIQLSTIFSFTDNNKYFFCEMDFFFGKRNCSVTDLNSETTKPHRDSFPIDDSN